MMPHWLIVGINTALLGLGGNVSVVVLAVWASERKSKPKRGRLVPALQGAS
jgi:hypothetical protein